jgi:hypothetical protein
MLDLTFAAQVVIIILIALVFYLVYLLIKFLRKK